MSTLLQSIKKWRMPSKTELREAMRGLTKREWFLFVGLIIALGITTFSILVAINNHFIVKIPAHGGTVRAGIVGTPRFINPVLAISEADKTLTSVVYSGLMHKDETGTLTPDAAQSYTVSPNGLVYTFTLRDKLTFHDGKALTADDVVYTITKIQDPLIKSPKRPLFEGIEVAAPDAKTVVFTLKQPFAPFLESATVGILPKHVWENVTADTFALTNLNEQAIGSGAYKISKITNNSEGTPTKYALRAFSHFAPGRAYIEHLDFIVYTNERDLVAGFTGNNVDMISNISPEKTEALAQEKYTITHSPLPRIFSLFFNQSQAPLFTDRAVIDAINLAVDKQQIVNEVLLGYGHVAQGPIPEMFKDGSITPQKVDADAAKNILTKAGYTKDTDGILKKGNTRLAFSISTGDAPELRKAAELVKQDLEAIGMSVELKVYEVGILNQTIIRPREYEALLFGQIVNTPADLYSFWHSGERNDPGLNVALYANTKVDSILESAPKETDQAKAKTLYSSLEQLLVKDAPAVFLYEPDAIYIMQKQINNFTPTASTYQGEQFRNAYTWYVRTDSVWKFFAKNKNQIAPIN